MGGGDVADDKICRRKFEVVRRWTQCSTRILCDLPITGIGGEISFATALVYGNCFQSIVTVGPMILDRCNYLSCINGGAAVGVRPHLIAILSWPPKREDDSADWAL